MECYNLVLRLFKIVVVLWLLWHRNRKLLLLYKLLEEGNFILLSG